MDVVNVASPKETRLNFHLDRLQKRIAGKLRQGFYSEFNGYGFRRDLGEKFKMPDAKIPIAVRRMNAEEIDIVLPPQGGNTQEETQEIVWRRHFYRKAPQNCCFAAIDLRDNAPCFIQWLIGPEHNGHLARFKCYPRLKDDEAMVEQSYTMPAYRGLGILAAAMARIAEQASGLGARHVMGFLGEDNTTGMKALRKAGFHPYLSHRRTQIGYGSLVFNSFKVIDAATAARIIS